MHDGLDVPLRRGAEVIEAARSILKVERERLGRLIPDPDLRLVGGSSVPGALTRGDVDLHLRVAAPDFDRTVALLRPLYEVVHPEIWQPTLATFSVPAPLPAGLAVTPAGSEHDLRFTRCWHLLTADPDLLGEYNRTKLASHGGGATEYERRKSAFFDRLLELWPVHPLGERGTAQDP